MTYIKLQLSGGAGTTQTAAGGSQARQQPRMSVPTAMSGQDARAHDAAAALIRYGNRLSPGPFASHGPETTADPPGRLTQARDLAYTLAVATGHSPAEALRVAAAAVGGTHAVCFVTSDALVVDVFAQPPRASELVSELESDPDIFDAVVETSCREDRSFSEMIASDYSHLSRTEQRVLNRETAAVVFAYVNACAAYEAVQSLRVQLASARVEEVGHLRAQLRAHAEQYRSLLSLVDGMQTQINALSAAQTAAQTAVTALTGAKAYLGGQLPAAIDALSGFVEQVGALPGAFAELFARVRDSAAEISARAATIEDHAPHPAMTAAAQGQSPGTTTDLETIHKPATQASIDQRLGAGQYAIAVQALQAWAHADVSQEIVEAALTYALRRSADDVPLLNLMSAAAPSINTYRNKLAEIDAATEDVALRARAVQLLIAFFREERDPRGLHVGRLMQRADIPVDAADDRATDVVHAASTADGDASHDDGAAGHRDELPGTERDESDAALAPATDEPAPSGPPAAPATSPPTLTRAVPLSQVTRAAVDAKCGEGAEQYVLARLQEHPLVRAYGIPSVLLTVLIRYTACQPKLSTRAELYHEAIPWLESFERKHVPLIDGLLGAELSPDERSAVIHDLFAKIAAYLLDGYRLFQVLRQYSTWIPEARVAIAANPAASAEMLTALQARIDHLDAVVPAPTAVEAPAPTPEEVRPADAPASDVAAHVVALPASQRGHHPIYQLAELIFGFARHSLYGSSSSVHTAIGYLLWRGAEAGPVELKYWDYLYQNFLRIRRRVDVHYGIPTELPIAEAVERLRTLTADQAADRAWRITMIFTSLKQAMLSDKRKKYPKRDAVNVLITQAFSARHLTGDEAAAALAGADSAPIANESAWEPILGPGADAVVTELMSHMPAYIKSAVHVAEWQRLLALPDYAAVPSGYRWRALQRVIRGLQSGTIRNGDSEPLLHSDLTAWGESNAAVFGELLGVPLSSLQTPQYLPSATRNEILARAMAEAKNFDWDVATSPLGTPVAGAAAQLTALIDTFAEGWRPQNWREAVAVLRSGDIADVDNEVPAFHTLTTVPAGLTRATYAPILIAAVGKAMAEEWDAEQLLAHIDEQVAAALPPAPERDPEPEPPAPEPTGDAGTGGPTTSVSEAASAAAAPTAGAASFTLDPAAVARKRAQDAYRADVAAIAQRMNRLRADHADPDLVAEGDGKLAAVQAAVARGDFDLATLRDLTGHVTILEELK